MNIFNSYLYANSVIATGSNCNNICNIKTVAVELADDILYLLLKRRIFENGERFGLIICSNVPCIAGDAPVRISVGIGPEALSYPMLTTNGQQVLAYQLPKRCRIPVTVSTTDGAFLVNPRYLCHTNSILPVDGGTTADEGGN